MLVSKFGRGYREFESPAVRHGVESMLDVLGDRLETMRDRVVDALENSNGYRMAAAALGEKKNPRVTEGFNGCGDRI
jgi:hypothetical protein